MLDTTPAESASTKRKGDPPPTGIPLAKAAKPKPTGHGQKHRGRGNWLKQVAEAIPLHPLSKGDLHLTGIDISNPEHCSEKVFMCVPSVPT